MKIQIPYYKDLISYSKIDISKLPIQTINNIEFIDSIDVDSDKSNMNEDICKSIVSYLKGEYDSIDEQEKVSELSDEDIDNLLLSRKNKPKI